MDDKINNNNNNSDNLVNNPIATITEKSHSSDQQQTVQFSDSQNIYSVDASAERDETYYVGQNDEAPLGDFLSRPVSLQTITWTTYTPQKTEIDPWVLWQGDDRVIHKLSNFAYGSFNLNVRFLLNSTPFHYGRMMIVYVPYGDNNKVAQQLIDTSWTSAVSTAGDEQRRSVFQYFSTYQHAWLVAGDNNEVEMKLPFVWHNNFFPLAGSSSVDRFSCGKLLLLTVNELAVVNADVASVVDIRAYAWASEISIHTPTEFVPASGQVKQSVDTSYCDDEADDTGKVSHIAANVADAAGMLSMVPTIGPYATAAQIASQGVSSIARLFGFSRPTSQHTGDIYMPRSTGLFSHTIGSDTAVPLSLDPSNQVTIDPRAVGIRPTDEMTFSSICTREQWLTKVRWTSSGGVMAAPVANTLFVSNVTPCQQYRHSITGPPLNRITMMTPACHIGRAFDFWNGSVTFRIQAVASKFHSGRLMLQFDPFVKSAAVAATDVQVDQVNARKTMVLDLSDAREVEFTIPYVSYRPWLRSETDESVVTFQPRYYHDTAFTLDASFDENKYMGIFSIIVINDLVAPLATDGVPSTTKAPIDVNIYMRCNSDIRFAQPTDNFSDVQLIPASGMVDSVEAANWDEDTVLQATQTDSRNLVFFGETVTSWRSVLKRYTKTENRRSGVSTTANMQMIKRIFPMYPAARDSTATGLLRRTSLIGYVSPCFLIKRGGMRWKMFPLIADVESASTGASYASGYVSVMRNTWVAAANTAVATQVNNVLDSTAISAISTYIPDGVSGMDMVAKRDRVALEVQLPFYNDTRFLLATTLQNVSTAANEPMVFNYAATLWHGFYGINTGYNAASDILALYCAAAEDFCLHYYLAPPPFYAYA